MVEPDCERNNLSDLLHLPAHLGHGEGELPGQAGQAEPQVSPGQVAAGQGAGARGHGPEIEICRVSENVQVCHEAVILMMNIQSGGHAETKFSWTIELLRNFNMISLSHYSVLPRMMSNTSKDELN